MTKDESEVERFETVRDTVFSFCHSIHVIEHMLTYHGSRGKFNGFSEECGVTGRSIENGTGESEWREKTGVCMEIFEHESSNCEKWENYSEGRRESDNHGHCPKDEVEVDR